MPTPRPAGRPACTLTTADGTREKRLHRDHPVDTLRHRRVRTHFSPGVLRACRSGISRVLNAGGRLRGLPAGHGDRRRPPGPRGHGGGRAPPRTAAGLHRVGPMADNRQPRDGYDPQYSRYALWDPADFWPTGSPPRGSRCMRQNERLYNYAQKRRFVHNTRTLARLTQTKF